jgi:hypothetical protein
MTLDTLTLARDLQAAGFTPEQAQQTAAALARSLAGETVTKTDVELIVERAKNEILRWLIPLILAQIGAVIALFFRMS